MKKGSKLWGKHLWRITSIRLWVSELTNLYHSSNGYFIKEETRVVRY